MKMMLYVAVVCLLGHILGGEVITDAEPEDARGKWDPPKVLGRNRGKVFAAGRTKGPWHYAVSYCYRNGYAPAIIDDRQDLKWVAERPLSGVAVPSPVWTSGTDFPVSRVFTWYETRSFVNTTALGVVLADPGKSCLAINIQSPTRYSLYEEHCVDGAGGYPLCEKRVSV